MPKIREYAAPELNFQEVPMQGFGELRGGVDTARSIQRLGGAVESGFEQIYQREEQEQASEVNAGTSELAARITEEAEQATQDGSIKANEFVEKVQTDIDKLGDGISTPGARRVYERNAGRLKALAIKKASRGQALVAGVKAQANMQAEMNNYSASLTTDPSNFQEHLQAMHASIDDQVGSGALKIADAEKLKLKANEALAEATVSGYARLNPDLAEKKLNSGEYDGYLNGDQKRQMMGYIDSRRNAKKAQLDIAEASAKRAQRLKVKAWEEKNMPDIVKGTISAEQILDDHPGTLEQKNAVIAMAQRSARRGGVVSDPIVLHDIAERIYLPPGDPRRIEDPSQVYPLVGDKISSDELTWITKEIQRTPEGAALRAAKKSAFQAANDYILQKNQTGRGYTPDSRAKALEWNQYRLQQEQEAAAKNIPISELYNPTSPHYVANPQNLSRFRVPYGGLTSQAYSTLQNRPIYQPTNLPSDKPDDKPKPGESIKDWKTRTGRVNK